MDISFNDLLMYSIVEGMCRMVLYGIDALYSKIQLFIYIHRWVLYAYIVVYLCDSLPK